MVHTTLDILRQRIYALVLGHEDLNDHRRLRLDPALQAAAMRDRGMASPSTLCRFERRSSPAEALALHGVLFEQFVAAHPVPPKRILLDFDATDVTLHGMQEGRHWHGHYRSHCYLPLYVFSGHHLLAAVLQPSDRDAAWRAGAVLKLLTDALRREWPGVEVILRGDCGFCRPRIMRWCEKAGVGYVLGLPSNKRLAAPAGKAEHTGLGANTRFIVTNLDMDDDPQGLYDGMYCERGEMENRIKDQQLGLFADRASSSDFHANQLRLLLSGLAHTLIEGMRGMALHATDLAKASPQTIRLTLLKVGTVVVSNTRRVRLLMSRSHPDQALFRRVAAALAPQPP